MIVSAQDSEARDVTDPATGAGDENLEITPNTGKTGTTTSKSK